MIGCQALNNVIWMMLRIKQQRVTPPDLATSTHKRGWLLSLAIVCHCITVGVVVILGQIAVHVSPPTLILSVVIAAINCLLSGLCLAEFLTSQNQGARSVYVGCYQSASEVVAFFVGWSFLISSCSMGALISRVLSSTIDELTHSQITAFFHGVISSGCPDFMSVALILATVLLSLTGIGEKSWWFQFIMPVLFIMSVAIVAIIFIATDNAKWSSITNYQVLGLDEVLFGAAVCSLIFMGSHSVFRVHPRQVHQRVPAILGPLNAVCFVFTFLSAVLLAYTLRFTPVAFTSHVPLMELLWLRDCVRCWYVVGFILVLSLCLLQIEAYHPLHGMAEDMASDGLLLRSMSKRWTPFCGSIPSPVLQVLTALSMSLLAMILSIENLLRVAVFGPLMTNTVVCILVLLQRYQDRDAWQYEPMLQSPGEAVTHKPHSKTSNNACFQNDQIRKSESAKTSEEQTGMSNTCFDDSENDSETDIDAVVQEYKDQIQVKNLTNLDAPISDSLVKEPTPSTSLRAKWCVTIMSISYLSLGLLITVGCRTDTLGHLGLIIPQILCFVVSIVALSILSRLPQNRLSNLFSNKHQSRVPLMPWVPAIATFLPFCLLLHIIVNIWHVVLVWTLVGSFVYFVYGLHSSTAASSFHSMQIPAQLTLQPLPSHGDSCITQIVPSHRRFGAKKKRHQQQVFVLQ